MSGLSTLSEVRKALKDIENIERPDSDNDGDALNWPDVYNHLSEQDQQKVDHAEQIVGDYVRDAGGAPNKRNITNLNKAGFTAYFQDDQYDNDRRVGRVTVGEWELDISDPASSDADSY